MAKSNASGLLTSLDSLFTTQEQRDAAKRDVVLDLPLDQIGDFPNHPFKVRQDEAMMEMMESVQLPAQAGQQAGRSGYPSLHRAGPDG